MKSILKVSVLSALLILTSCAHHGGCCKHSCEKKCDGNKDQCPMKSEHKDSAAPAAAPATK